MKKLCFAILRKKPIKFYLRPIGPCFTTAMSKIQCKRKIISPRKLQGQDQFCGRFFPIEDVEFICDSHGQTFPSPYTLIHFLIKERKEKYNSLRDWIRGYAFRDSLPVEKKKKFSHGSSVEVTPPPRFLDGRARSLGRVLRPTRPKSMKAHPS